MTREALDRVNPHLLPFLTHDRVTLAGTMLAIGVMYCGLSWFGVRRGLHWAMVAVEASAFVGFASFFLFLGFGYFDPFHAFVTVVLLQLLLLGVHSRLGPSASLTPPDLHNDARWMCASGDNFSAWRKASAFVLAGLVISFVGVTSVFVPEDLEFMGTTARELHLRNPLLVAGRPRSGEFRGDVGCVGVGVLDVRAVGPQEGSKLALVDGPAGGDTWLRCGDRRAFRCGLRKPLAPDARIRWPGNLRDRARISHPYFCCPMPELAAESEKKIATRG